MLTYSIKKYYIFLRTEIQLFEKINRRVITNKLLTLLIEKAKVNFLEIKINYFFVSFPNN